MSMRRATVAFLLFVSLAAAESAHAVITEGTRVIIPAIGRFPGAGGSLWRTDVFLMNPSTQTPTVTFKFYATSGLRTHSVVLQPFTNRTFRDIVLNTFGSVGAGGPLEIEATSGIGARARIYNAGSPAGEFSQGVEGIATDRLSRQSLIYGLSGSSGYRLNIGVTNPNDRDVEITLYVVDQDRHVLHQEVITLAPHTYTQFNDIIALWSIPPQDGIQVEMSEFDDVFYGFASEVRNDTGDAIFIFGTAPNTGP